MRLSHDTLKQQIGSRASSRCTSPRASSSGGPRPNGTNEWDSDFGDSRNEVSSSPYNRSSPPSPPAEDALLGVEVSSLSEIALDKVGYLRTSGRSKSASGVLPSGGALGNGGMPSGGAELPWEKELPSPSRSPRLSNSRRSSVRFAKQDITHHVAADFGGESSQSARTGRRSFDRAVPNVRIVQNPSGGSSPSRRSLDDARLSRLANAGGGTLDSNRFALASPRVSRLSHFDGDRRSASMSGIALPGDGALKQQLDEANLENERLRAKLMELGFNPPSRRPHPPDPDDPHAVWDEHSLAE